MNQALDIDALHDAGGLIPTNWAARLPNNSVPYTSTILFVVRKGNPKGIKDWDDLVKPGVSVIIPSPKTSGNGRYSYLAAWGYALRRPGGSEAQAHQFVKDLFTKVPVLDTGGRAATTTFAQRGMGDVLLTFENEAASLLQEPGGEKLDAWLRLPSASWPKTRVTWVDKVVKNGGTEALAKAHSNTFTAMPGRNSRRGMIFTRAMKPSWRSTPHVSDPSNCLPLPKSPAAGGRRKRRILMTAASLTKFTNLPNNMSYPANLSTVEVPRPGEHARSLADILSPFERLAAESDIP